MGVGERSDEEADRKADSAHHRHGIDVSPFAPLRHASPAHLDEQPNRAGDADLFSEEESARDAQRDRVEQKRGERAYFGKRHARVDEAEQRQDTEIDPRRERVFRLDEGGDAVRVLETQRDAEGGQHACDRCMHGGVENADPQDDSQKGVGQQRCDAASVQREHGEQEDDSQQQRQE